MSRFLSITFGLAALVVLAAGCGEGGSDAGESTGRDQGAVVQSDTGANDNSPADGSSSDPRDDDQLDRQETTPPRSSP